MDKGINAAFSMESHVARIISSQEIRGVCFNVNLAKQHLVTLEGIKQRLYDNIRPVLSLEVEQPYGVPVNKPWLKDGSYSAMVEKWYGEESDIVWGQFTRVEFVEPNLGSRAKLIAQLLRLGWSPEHYTEPSDTYPEGSPKLTYEGRPCDSLNHIGTEEGQWIADWYTYNHRQSQIRGWLYGVKSNGFIPRVREDGRIPAEAVTIGTNTFRFRHRKVVNVPKASKKVKFGKEMRELFTASEGRVLVGHDASGLELRMLAHFLNVDTFTHAVVHGKSEDGTDIHSRNRDEVNLPDRDAAKTFIYACILYGAGDEKAGSIVGGSAKDGAKVKRIYFDKNPELLTLIKSVTKASKRGYLYGLDGRKVYMRRDKVTKRLQTHKALNTLLQSAGALVMKYSMVFLDKWVRDEGLDVWKVVDYHDEAIGDVIPEHAERYKELAILSVVKAGEYLGLKCPLDAGAAIGKDWSEIH